MGRGSMPPEMEGRPGVHGPCPRRSRRSRAGVSCKGKQGSRHCQALKTLWKPDVTSVSPVCALLGPVSSYWGPKCQSHAASWEMYVGGGTPTAHRRGHENRSVSGRWQTAEATSNMPSHRGPYPQGRTEWQTIFGFFYFSSCYTFLVALRQVLQV